MIHERNLNTESAAERASESHVCRRCYLELFIGDLSLCTSDYSIIVLILFKLFGNFKFGWYGHCLRQRTKC